ncbi:sodium:proton antiporter [Bifidobacterium pullorum subsp. saeculare]|uniref:Sodium:proton antiporter n=1 Tax=Bifidobacterium pullorum subsp. saeculare TaxID=78257 RepID=A0A938WZ88_9BIFI|nr:sodium:proton antiporter [Bifidobacterium pullorum]MBM6699357.1 sodium:proton antiporter [Bifidobacterium pullorum subsp. saeculare]
MGGMDILVLALLVLIAVLISSVLSQFLPKISTPLVQIALGVAWYFTPFLPNIQLNPDLFMALFIAPLFYMESRNMNRAVLARDVKLSLSLAVGLVMVSMFTAGFALHALWPAVTLVIAFAVGAILSPTDAVSVAQLGEQVELTERQRSILQSESLLNDPVSIVGFSTAMLALGSGEFSPVDFTAGVIFNFVMGTLIGAVVGLLFDWLVMAMRRRGLENTTNRIMMEIFLPFGAYVIAEHCGVSGLLAVVAAGLVITFPNRGVGGDIARTNLVSNSVWEFLDFTLNGSVFVLLGVELPIAMRASYEHHQVSMWLLVGAVAMLTAIMLALRFVWCYIMLKFTRDEKTHLRRAMTRARWHSVWVMTFGGPKGAISLAMALTIPYSVDDASGLPIRSSLLFIVSGFIIVSLLMTNIALPLLSPKSQASTGAEFAKKNTEMLRRTIARIAEMDSPQNHSAVSMVMRSYNDRIERQRRAVPDEELRERHHLRITTLEWESEWLRAHLGELHERLEHGADIAEEEDATHWMLDHVEEALQKLDVEESAGRGLGFRLAGMRRHFMPTLRRVWSGIARRAPLLEATRSEALQQVQVPLYTEMIARLHQEMQRGRYNAETISGLMVEYRRALRMMRARMDTIVTSSDHASQTVGEVRMEALRIELATIREMADANEISKDDARIMRSNVYVIQADAVM